jgi:hypothetical protein
VVDLRLAAAGVAQGTRHRLDVFEIAHVDLDDVPARSALELGRGPAGEGSAVVDDHDVVGEVVGFVEVLGGQYYVGSVGNEFADGFPQVDSAARIESSFAASSTAASPKARRKRCSSGSGTTTMGTRLPPT